MRGPYALIMPEVTVDLDRVATGGASIGPGPDGRLVFVTGGLPGERVVASIDREHRSRIEATAAAIEVAAPTRRSPPCPEVARSCGGCDLQHASPDGQRELRRDIVVDCLRRLGGVTEPVVELGPPLPVDGYRTSVRMAVVDGRSGYRASRSHEVVTVGSCLVAHPLVAELITEGRFGSAEEVTIRVGARTGERLVVAHPTAEGVAVPDDVVVVGTDELDAGHPAAYHEEIGGHRLRVSARSFFQCRPDGAELLVDLVASALDGADGPLLDAYCGVGLFGATLGGDGPEPVIGVESNRAAVADAEVNYGLRGSAIRARMERWRPRPVGAIVADPARSGLGRVVVDRLGATGAPVVALVSCDPASLARDARLLIDRGYTLDRVTVVDLFGHTSHVETVARFVLPGTTDAR